MATSRSAQLRCPIIVYMRPSSLRRDNATSMPSTSALPPTASRKIVIWTPTSAVTSASSRRASAGHAVGPPASTSAVVTCTVVDVVVVFHHITDLPQRPTAPQRCSDRPWTDDLAKSMDDKLTGQAGCNRVANNRVARQRL